MKSKSILSEQKRAAIATGKICNVFRQSAIQNQAEWIRDTGGCENVCVQGYFILKYCVLIFYE